MTRRCTAAVGLLLCLFCRATFGQDTPDLATQMMRATVKIAQEKSTATGFLLHQNEPNRFILVTAAHVFESTPAAETTVYFREINADGYRKLATRLMIRKNGQPLWTRHPTQDIAVMSVGPPNAADLPKVSIDLLATDEFLKAAKIHPGDVVNALGYPHRNESNDAGFPILRNGPIAGFPILPTERTGALLISANIFEGDSGGPVFLSKTIAATDPSKPARNTDLILGLITAQRFIDEDLNTLYGHQKIRHRLGLSTVVHAAFIRQAIERLP